MLYIFFTQVLLFIVYNLFVLILILFFLAIILVYYFKAKFNKKINNDKQKIFIERIKKYSNPIFSWREKISEYDKIYHNILLEAWYNWTFWDILKSKPQEIEDIDHIWELHKLRNKIAHDIVDISENILNKKALEFEKEIFLLIDKFK